MLIMNLTSNKHSMKLIYKLFIALVILLTPQLADAQINVFSFKVLDQYLKDGKILIKNSEATEIKIEVKFSTARDAQGKPKVGKIRTALGTKNSSGDIVYLTDQQEVFNTDFIAGEVYLTKTYTVNIQKSKLTNNIIDLLQQQPGGLPTESPTRYNYVVETPVVTPPSPITINSVNKVETILFGTDCGFPHAYGTSYNPNGFMENGVWKFAYDISFTKNNASVVDSDIYWEWEVADMSNYPVTEKQFLVYPYGTVKGTPMNGNKKVFVEANDYLDEYDSKVFVRAKSRSTGSVLSSTFTLYFNGVNH